MTEQWYENVTITGY